MSRLFGEKTRVVAVLLWGACVAACASTPAPPASCGDMLVQIGEQCDDGNTDSGDGCSATCNIEVPQACGNGLLEPGEQCDDGNTAAGDGCSATCSDELPPVCGNGDLEPGEQCDDGNITSGDGCSGSCDEEAGAMCGDGRVDPDEECDDGNTTAGDGCSATCTDEPPAPGCGNGVREGAEQCDDGNTTAGDGCSATCTNEPPPPACGNGVREGAEACDDGNTMSGDGCSSTCTIELPPPACGNGVREGAEACDDGNTMSGDGCSSTCTIEPPPGMCGNGVIDGGEECDDGNIISGDRCSATCQFEGGTCTPEYIISCGATDSYSTALGGATDVVNWYSCSPWNESGPEYSYLFVAPSTGSVTVTLSGLTVDLDVFVLGGGACSSEGCIAHGETSATFMATAGTTYNIVVDGFAGAVGSYTINLSCAGGFCGNGVVNVGEECDDGDMSSGDGCSSGCDVEYCGDLVVQAGLGEECDDGNAAAGDGCSAACLSEVGACVPDLIIDCPGSDTWNTGSGGTTDVVNAYGCVAWDESGPEYSYLYIAPVTGAVTAELSGISPGIDLDLFVVEELGSGCDPISNCLAYADASVTFTAEAGRHYYIIVDGFGGDSGAYTLSFSCAGGNVCGNGSLGPYEQCDDGNATPGDGCTFCQIDGGSCAADLLPVGCGAFDYWSTEALGATDRVNLWSCVPFSERGPEYTYSFITATDTDVTVTLTPEFGVDLDLFVTTDSGFGCTPGNCVAYGDTVTTFYAIAGTQYFVTVDGYLEASGDFGITFDCP